MVCIEIHVSCENTGNSPVGGKRRALTAEVERYRSNSVGGFAVHVPAQREAFLLPCQGPEAAAERPIWHVDPKVAIPRWFQQHVIGEDFQRWWDRTALVSLKREGIKDQRALQKGRLYRTPADPFVLVLLAMCRTRAERRTSQPGRWTPGNVSYLHPLWRRCARQPYHPAFWRQKQRGRRAKAFRPFVFPAVSNTALAHYRGAVEVHL
jgi:hypothetical protein